MTWYFSSDVPLPCWFCWWIMRWICRGWGGMPRNGPKCPVLNSKKVQTSELCGKCSDWVIHSRFFVHTDDPILSREMGWYCSATWLSWFISKLTRIYGTVAITIRWIYEPINIAGAHNPVIRTSVVALQVFLAPCVRSLETSLHWKIVWNWKGWVNYDKHWGHWNPWLKTINEPSSPLFGLHMKMP